MGSEDSTTLLKIMDEGKKEFLDKGYKDASLRNIVKRAGVTTGAFYGYYPDKAALFGALVSPAAEKLRKFYLSSVNEFEALPQEQKIARMRTHTNEAYEHFVDYIYEHFDAFKLIVCCSAGTDYEHYIDSLIEVEVESTQRFIQTLKENGHTVADIYPDLIHMLASACYTGIFETVAHDMPKDDTARYIATLVDFFQAGWDKILGLT